MVQKHIRLMAFVRDATGELVPAFPSREMPSEERAKQDAAMMRPNYVGVVAWKREGSADGGGYGPAVIVVKYGDVPDMTDEPTNDETEA